MFSINVQHGIGLSAPHIPHFRNPPSPPSTLFQLHLASTHFNRHFSSPFNGKDAKSHFPKPIGHRSCLSSHIHILSLQRFVREALPG